MVTIGFPRAHLVIDGFDLPVALHDLHLAYGTIASDQTTFGGNETRMHRGGTASAHLSGYGRADIALLVPNLLFAGLGVEQHAIAVFPDGLTVDAMCGYAMNGIEEEFEVRGTARDDIDVVFAFEAVGYLDRCGAPESSLQGQSLT